jgi:trehalose-6-phosphatase
MGKPFARELESIPATLQSLAEVDVAPLSDFFDRAQDEPLFLIGAGGSHTAAMFASLLFEERGGIALVQTPLDFIQNNSDVRKCSVVIFTASGNNQDVLAALKAALEKEVKRILIFCGATGSKIEVKAKGQTSVQTFLFTLPTGKDGYLATNSLIAFLVLTHAAFGFSIPSSTLVRKALGSKSMSAASKVRSNIADHYIVLSSDWARPAATDMESKFSEAGLGGVMLADYRNFAHGRHNWIDKRGTNSIVVALITPPIKLLAERTLLLIRPHIRTLEIETKMPKGLGTIELLLSVFSFTQSAGESLGIDPGRPGVPNYGSRLYRLGPGSRPSGLSGSKNKSIKELASVRKARERGTTTDSPEGAFIRRAFVAYARKLGKARFGALILDFDGTVAPAGIGNSALPDGVRKAITKLIRSKIQIYFATGRGDSIHGPIQLSFPEPLWPWISVSYYNGALTLPFIERARFASELPHWDTLGDVTEQIQNQPSLMSLVSCKNNGCQVTIKPKSGANRNRVMTYLQEIVARFNTGDVRIVQSSHSIDVIPAQCSKTIAIRAASSAVRPGLSVLSIGDRGAWPGNDYDLLSHPYSLSVDTISTALDSCWNCLPASKRNVAGFVTYSTWMRVQRDYFTLRFTMGSHHE